jgi:hypothetical protein
MIKTVLLYSSFLRTFLSGQVFAKNLEMICNSRFDISFLIRFPLERKTG